MSAPEQQRVPSRRRERATLAWLLVIMALCLGTAVAGFSIVNWQRTARASGVFLEDANPNLSLVERIVLQNYLVNRGESLQQPSGNDAGQQTFSIPPGATADSVAEGLAAAGLLTDRELFLNYLRFYGLDGRLQAGEFTLDSQWSIPELASVVADAGAQNVQVNIFAGMRIEETADYLAKLSPANVDAAEFLALARRELPFDASPYAFLATLSPDDTLEGYLMPGLYSLPPQADAAFLITLMLQNFDAQVTPPMRQAFGAQGLSLREALTLGSIVAREAVVPEERPLIAGVYLNRLNNDTLLQADPTVQYALGYQPASRSWWKNPLSLADLQVDHPHNTYIYSGLPPGPISSPGPSVLQAVADPAQTDYFFFVLDCEANTGEHLFSTTFEEHLIYARQCQ